MERHKLYIEPNLTIALKLKMEEQIPHIHFSIEKDCDPFTASLIWLEVLMRAVSAARTQGACVVSYNNDIFCRNSLSKDELRILSELQRETNLFLDTLDIIDKRR